MRRGAALLMTTILAAAGCGLPDGESDALATRADPVCAERAAELVPAEAAEAAERVVWGRASHAGVYFVDACHRAALVTPDDVASEEEAAPLLVVLPYDGGLHEQPWEDALHEGGLFLLERDPTVPEAWRLVSDRAGVVVPEALEPDARRALEAALDRR